MKAIRVHNYGPPSALVEEEVPEPTPGEVDVVLQVFASGVGPWDALLRTGADRTIFGDLPLIPGSDVAGVVEAVGSGVRDLRQGDRVDWVWGILISDFIGKHFSRGLGPGMWQADPVFNGLASRILSD